METDLFSVSKLFTEPVYRIPDYQRGSMGARTVWIIAFAFMAGCGSGGSGGSPQMPSRFMYVNADQGPNEFYTETYGFTVSSGGALQPVTGLSPAPSSLPGGGPLAIAFDSKLLYTTNTDGQTSFGIADQINAFQINPDGSLTHAPNPSLSMADNPVGLVAHPTAGFLYVSSGSGVLSVFAITSGTGALNLTSSVSLGGNNIEPVNSQVITPNGKYLYQADVYHPNGLGQPPAVPQLAAFSIDPATGALSAVPGGPISISTNISIGTMSIDPTGKFLYASYEDHNEVAAFSIDATSGMLTAVSGSPFTVGGSATTIVTTIAVDASGKFLIVGLEPGAVGNCLDVLSIDSGTGALTLVPGSPFPPAALYCPVVTADPSEPLVYAGTGGIQPGPGVPPATVVTLSVDQTTGALTPVGQAAVPNTTKVTVDFIAVTH
jgi:6-phosphogluconolactonase (cycloisomerase 2 family)